MSVQRDKPYPGFNFIVDLGDGDTNTVASGSMEVVIPDARIHIYEYRNGNDKINSPRKIETLTRYENLILRRGVTGSLNWYAWWNAVRNGEQVSRTIRVSLLDEARTGIVQSWLFLQARPISYRCSPLHALGTELLTETLEIVFERLEME